MADDILREALEAFQETESREARNRREALDDLRFARLGEQWDERIKRQRKAERRPTLTINKMPAFIRQVVNDSRQNKPSIKVHPVEKGDVKTAEVLNGLIRNIEVTSNADIAYDTAVESAVGMGFGYIRVNLDYACDDTFEKDVVIKAVPNPFAIYGDPYSQAADSSDWMTAFIIDETPESVFKRRFPKAKKIDFTSAAWTRASGWSDGERKIIRVAEYWKRDEITRTAVFFVHPQLQGVQWRFAEDLEALFANIGPAEQIIGERPVKSYKVRQHRLNGVEVLDETDWVGSYIPIIPVYGDEVNIEGERYFRSLIRDAKDPARNFNFWRSTTTELVGLGPRAPFIGPEGAFDEDAEKWATINTVNHAYVEYKVNPAAPNGGMPQRQPFAGIPAGPLQEALNAADDMKAVMGIYDASLGARSNETSGRAIMARQREGDVSTFHFIDNLARAIRHTGKVLIDLIPKVYNQDRIVRVLGEDGKPDTVQIVGGETPSDPDAGIYNLTVGKYDLTVKSGPSFTTQREEARAMLIELVRGNKEIAPIVGDKIIEFMDIPGGEVITKRLQALLPPAVKAAEEGQSPEVQAAQAQLQQAGQIIQQQRAQLQAAQTDVEAERMKQANEAEKLRIEAFKAETERMQLMQQSALNLSQADPQPGNPRF